MIGDKIKPALGASHKSGQRSTIMLREFPDDATQAEIQELLTYINSKPIVEIHAEIGGNWLV